MRERAEESFATSASAKQKPLHCSAMITRKLTIRMDHHAVPPPEYQTGDDSKRENLCQQDSGRVARSMKLRTTGSDWSNKLRATDRLLQKILQVKRKFMFIQILMEKITSGISTILQRIQRSTHLPIMYWTVYVQDLVNILPIFQTHRSTVGFGTKCLILA